MLFYNQFYELATATKDRSVASPALFKLTRNFRSHRGIIALASFIMKLMVTGKRAPLKEYTIFHTKNLVADISPSLSTDS
jgi:hypothetical protein